MSTRSWTEAMVWGRAWRSRVAGAPLLLLLITSGLGFLLGLVAPIIAWEFLKVSYPSSSASSSSSSFPPDRPGALSLSQPPADLLNFRENCTQWQEVPAEKVRAFILDSVFDGKSPFDGFPSDEISPLLRKKRIKGWGSEASVFERLMREVRPALIVEVGAFLGASAIHMGQLAGNLSLSPTILCLDDFRGWPGFRADKFKDIKIHNGENLLYHQFLKNVEFMNLTDCILPVPFSTAAALLKFCEWGVRPDLIEVDAGHDFHSAWLDINYASAILKPGGVMFGHDYFNRGHGKGVRRAVELFARLKNLKVEPDGKHWILRNSSFVSTNRITDPL